MVASSLRLQLAADSKEVLCVSCRLHSAAHKYLHADVQRKGWWLVFFFGLVCFFLQYVGQQLLENSMGMKLLTSVSLLWWGLPIRAISENLALRRTRGLSCEIYFDSNWSFKRLFFGPALLLQAENQFLLLSWTKRNTQPGRTVRGPFFWLTSPALQEVHVQILMHVSCC